MTGRRRSWTAMAGETSVWSTLIGRAPTLLRSHLSRAFPVMLAPAVLCHKEPTRASKAIQVGTRGFGTQNTPNCLLLVLYHLWHKTAGEVTPRNRPRHLGGPVCP